MKTLTVKLREELVARLEALADERQTTKSDLVRSALEILVRDKPQQGPSCYELSEDLSGTVDGPADLSSGKRHMKGYGQ